MFFGMLNVKMASAVKIGKHLKELRFHLCQTSTASQGIRDFINESYVTLKKANPKFPFLVRECANVPPKVYARYAFGKESSLPLNNMSKDQVARAVETLIAKK